MPELPEVETMVRGIRSHVEGGKILNFAACPCDCRPITLRPNLEEIRRQARGRTIVEVRRRAKRVVLQLDTGAAFVIEPRMTGLMLISDPPDPDHLRFVWTLQQRAKKNSVWFWDRRGLGTLSLLSPSELERLDSHDFLGPDALHVDIEYWSRICHATKRPIKILLLDQSKIAGIGNLYASEILHLSQIHPETPADQLTPAQMKSMSRFTRDVLLTAIEHEGSTLSDGTYRNALNQSGGYQNAHRVYDREGEVCASCRLATIVRIVQSQRSTFFCPHCQPVRSKHRRRSQV